MIKTVIRIKNDMVMVFDENGKEMPRYQGYYSEVKDKIIEDAQSGSIFNHWFGYSLKPVAVGPERW
ncbi:MAG: hypothetical protein A2Y58_01120 [Chloroflexi bacterium RBG_13_51_52]|nr:MAG: hypothetical protein A2Y58_01120 [Chloroflexi bacterium RBG_13_51_52]